MQQTAALAASLGSLALVTGMYFCNIRARPASWLKSEVLAMILLALLTGLFPFACAMSLVGLWDLLFNAGPTSTAVAAGGNLASLAILVATIAIFRALVRATYRQGVPDRVAPFTPRPLDPGATPRSVKRAA